MTDDELDVCLNRAAQMATMYPHWRRVYEDAVRMADAIRRARPAPKPPAPCEVLAHLNPPVVIFPRAD